MKQPIKLVTKSDFGIFAELMYKAAALAPVGDPLEYSKDIAEAVAKAMVIGKQVQQTDLCQVLIVDGKLISCSFTLDCFEEPKKWHLSLGLITPTGIPDRVPDEQVNKILDGFGGFEELVLKQAFSNVRHFFKVKKEEKEE
jgi:hypothetical protein